MRAVVLHINGHPLPQNFEEELRRQGFESVVVYRLNNYVDFRESAEDEARRLVNSLGEKGAFREQAAYFFTPGGVSDVLLLVFTAITALTGTLPKILVTRQTLPTKTYVLKEIIDTEAWRHHWRKHGRNRWVVDENVLELTLGAPQ